MKVLGSYSSALIGNVLLSYGHHYGFLIDSFNATVYAQYSLSLMLDVNNEISQAGLTASRI